MQRHPGPRRPRTSTTATRPAARRQEAEARLAELCDGHGELRIDANAPSGAGRARAAGRRADRRRRPRGRAQAGVDAGGRVRAGRARGGQLRARRPAAGAHARRVDLGRGARARLPRARALRGEALAVKPSPILTGLQDVPLRAADRGQARAARPRHRGRSTSASASRARTPPPFIREALAASLDAAVDLPARRGPARAARGGRGAGSRAASARALDPDTEVLPTLGSKEAIFHLAQVVGGDFVAVTTPGYPVAERGAAFAGKQVLELPLLAERGFLPDLGAVELRLGARRDPVAQLPEQPDRGDRPARALRAGGGDRARARRRGRLRRGVLGDLLRRGAAGLGARGRRPPQRDRVQHALQALLDARLPLAASWPATPR